MAVHNNRYWSPYIAGAAIGILSWFAFATADHPLGITTAFENSAALFWQTLTSGSSSVRALSEARDSAPKIDWEWMLVVGVFIGAWISSRLHQDRVTTRVPEPWIKAFGPSEGKRFWSAFAGGALMIFGARMAQGCTSGHGISGLLQLALSSLIFVVIFSLTAIVLTKIMYGRQNRV